MTARYAGTDNKGRPFAAGARVFYYPLTRSFLTGEDADAAASEFAEAAAVEDGGYY
jgi:hypothetical protein